MLPVSAIRVPRRRGVAKREEGVEHLQNLAVALWSARVHLERLIELELEKDAKANRAFGVLAEDFAGWDYQLSNMVGLLDGCAGNCVLRALVDAGLENVTRISFLEELIGDDPEVLRHLLEDDRSKRARETATA